MTNKGGMGRSCGGAGDHRGRAQRGARGRTGQSSGSPLPGLRVPGAVHLLVPRNQRADGSLFQRAVRGARHDTDHPKPGGGDAGRVRVLRLQRTRQARDLGGDGASVPAGRQRYRREILRAEQSGAGHAQRAHHSQHHHAAPGGSDPATVYW